MSKSLWCKPPNKDWCRSVCGNNTDDDKYIVASNTARGWTYEWRNNQQSDLTDAKASLHSGAKPDLTHTRLPTMTYMARAGEYGNAKYDRATYLRKTPSQADDFNRMRSYARAVISHTMKMLDAMEAHQATDPALTDIEGMKQACFAPDDDAGNDKVGPSNLPHICGAAASINMLITQAVNCGLLPADPGQPWTKK